MAGLTIPIEGDITPLLATFAKIPGRTQKELDAIARVTEREITSGNIHKAFAELPGVAGKSAKKAAAMVSKEMDKMAAETRARTGEMKQGLGAVFGSGLINDIGDVGAAFGPAGLAAMGLGIAITGVGAAAYAATSFLYNAALGTGQLEDENRALDAAMGSVYQTIGNEVAPTFKGLTIGVIAGTLAFNDFILATFRGIKRLHEYYEGLGTVGKAIMNTMGLNFGMLDTITALSDGFSDGSLTMGGYTDRALGLVGSLKVLDEVQHRTVKTTKAATKATKEASKVKQDAYDLNKIMFADEADNDRTLSAQIAKNSEDIAQTQQKKIDDAVALKDAQLSTMNAVASASDSLTSLIISNAQDGTDAQKSAALAFFRVNQAASATTAAINTYVAITEALKLGPIAGPIAALGIGITGFAQQAAILAAPLPFHDGGIVGQDALAPDEQMIRARRGEEVRTRQQQQSDRPMVVQVQQVYQHRAFNAFVADNVAQPTGPLARAIAGASTRRIGHRSYK